MGKGRKYLGLSILRGFAVARPKLFGGTGDRRGMDAVPVGEHADGGQFSAGGAAIAEPSALNTDAPSIQHWECIRPKLPLPRFAAAHWPRVANRLQGHKATSGRDWHLERKSPRRVERGVNVTSSRPSLGRVEL